MIRSIIGTGGHIDHGKTALVQALTGIHTDRLPEEQRRGITIDLGFAHLDLGDGVAGLIDVPGHEDFIRNMVAGASGFDLLLLVVAADEGVMPQTREHVAIARLLGVPRAVVAVTKTDLVDPEWLELAVDDVATFLGDTPFAGSAIVPTSAVTGAGVEVLREAIRAALPPPRGRPDDLFRLPVDRAFTVRGTGTVVTGTVWSGRLAVDAVIRILPGDRTARVRGLQVHGRDVERVEPGQRAAVALAGVDRDEASRGTTLVTDGAWTASPAVTVSLSLLTGSRWSVEHGQRLRVHAGTSEVMARAFLLDRQRLEPGEETWAQLRFEAPVVARTGDRFVVRSYSPVTTIGGGTVVEPAARRRRRLGPQDDRLLGTLRRGGPAERVVALVHRRQVAGVERRQLPILTGATPDEVDAAIRSAEATVAGGRAFSAEAARQVGATLLGALDDHHGRHPLQRGMELERLRRAAPSGTGEALVAHVLDDLLARRETVMVEGRVARPSFAPSLTPDQRATSDRILRTFQDAGYAPPRVDQLAELLGRPADLPDLMTLLEARGHLLRLEHDLFMHRETLDQIVRDVRTRFAGRTDVTPAEFREAVPVSRKHLIPILEHLDRAGVTVRAGEGRAVTGGRV